MDTVKNEEARIEELRMKGSWLIEWIRLRECSTGLDTWREWMSTLWLKECS